MIITSRPELSPEERVLPLAKYYDLPLYGVGPREQQILDCCCPIDLGLAIRPEDFLDLLDIEPTEYSPAEYGYCMMEDGSGYVAVYKHFPDCTPEMFNWWYRWMNFYCKGQPESSGNIKYKLWCPPDHFDHGFINGKDRSGGIYSVETLDLGQGDEPVYSIRHPVDLKEYGLTQKRERELNAAGCGFECVWESFHSVEPPHEEYPWAHISMGIKRPYHLGRGVENLSREWMGYRLQDGKLVRNESTPVDEAYMKKVVTHNIIEAQHLNRFLPQLYAEYRGKPDDAD